MPQQLSRAFVPIVYFILLFLTCSFVFDEIIYYYYIYILRNTNNNNGKKEKKRGELPPHRPNNVCAPFVDCITVYANVILVCRVRERPARDSAKIIIIINVFIHIYFYCGASKKPAIRSRSDNVSPGCIIVIIYLLLYFFSFSLFSLLSLASKKKKKNKILLRSCLRLVRCARKLLYG